MSSLVYLVKCHLCRVLLNVLDRARPVETVGKSSTSKPGPAEDPVCFTDIVRACMILLSVVCEVFVGSKPYSVPNVFLQ